MSHQHQAHPQYPIGWLGQPWGAAERALWFSQQQIKRSYQQLVVEPLHAMMADAALASAECVCYGELDHSAFGLPRYPVYAVRSRNWLPQAPLVLVTGGVHGYETSGVQGALQFIQQQLPQYLQRFAGKVNFLVLPCISPWGFETINRWNPAAIDPNRSFKADSDAAEALLAYRCVHEHVANSQSVLMHIDLHETTDSDNSEFRPAKASRDGGLNHNWNIPDGFYLVGDSERPAAEFQRVIIEAVAKVTHIAPADEQGCLIGEPLEQFGVVNYPKRSLFLCGGMTDATYVTTTEVYPDSPRTNPSECNAAQVAAVVAAIDYATQQLV